MPSSAPSTIPAAAAEGGSYAAPQQARYGRRAQGAALAAGLTVAGVLLLICALAALPDAICTGCQALTEGGSMDLAGRGFRCQC